MKSQNLIRISQNPGWKLENPAKHLGTSEHPGFDTSDNRSDETPVSVSVSTRMCIPSSKRLMAVTSIRIEVGIFHGYTDYCIIYIYMCQVIIWLWSTFLNWDVAPSGDQGWLVKATSLCSVTLLDVARAWEFPSPCHPCLNVVSTCKKRKPRSLDPSILHQFWGHQSWRELSHDIPKM